MKNRNTFNLSLVALMLALVFTSCEQDVVEPSAIENAEETVARATYGSRNVWFTWSNGSYTKSRLTTNFGNDGGTISSAEYGRLKINNNALRVIIPANTVGNASGVWAKINIQKGRKYSLEYKVRFESGFDWSRGGKLFGLSGGQSYSGCKGPQTRSNGDGWSMRPMFRKEPGKTAWMMPYAYHQKMTKDCGEDWGNKKNISVNSWITVKMVVQMNNGTSTDGKLKMIVNGSTITNRSMRWVTKSAGNEIDKLMFDVYRGGNDNSWKSSSKGKITIDNLKLVRSY
ncbi:MAG: hypothetical protein JXR10_04285 [Cyclobacteriaceae bacterium]